MSIPTDLLVQIAKKTMKGHTVMIVSVLLMISLRYLQLTAVI
jgi:hypothetical protein